MKILQISNKVPYPSLDGGAMAIRSLAEGYAEHGHSVDILAMNTPKHFVNPHELPLIPEMVRLEMVDVPAAINSFSALCNLLFSRLPYSVSRFADKNFASRLKIRLQNESYDVIQIEGLYCVSYIPLIRSVSKAKIFYRPHNIESEIWSRLAENETSVWKKLYLKNLASRLDRYEQKMLNAYDAILPITDRDSAVFAKMGNRKPGLVVPVALDIPVSDHSSFHIPDPPDFFHLGSLDWAPNQEGLRWFLKEVWAGFQFERKDARFFVAGRNCPVPFRKELESYPGVNYCGEVANAADFMRQHAVMIVPLLSGSGMRVKIVEGMLNSRCIISTAIGMEGIPAAHQKNCLIADQPAEMQNLMANLMIYPQNIEKIGLEAFIFAQSNFDRRFISGKVLELAEQLIQT